MRWPHETAITRRDDNLARTRRISTWIAGGATAASFGLAAALGYALPGHSYRAAPAGGQHAGTTSGGTGSSGGPASSGSQGGSGGLAPPQQPPSGSVAPPVVTSGGS